MALVADLEGRALTEQEISEAIAQVKQSYHIIFFAEERWMNLWCGIPVAKNPLDLWVYQEIINEMQPEIIIETGTYCGGSALYMAMCLDRLGRGAVITIDNKLPEDFPQRAAHPRIIYAEGSSVDPEIVGRAAGAAKDRRTMVLLDSDHHREHVIKELDAYAPLVSVGHYLIVEDTNLNGHPIWDTHGPGPWEAVEDWLPKHPEFQRDLRPEVFGFTFNPGGFLLKIA